MTVARVLPDVTGLDKHFDYLVPEHLAERIVPGSIVRVPLHGRRIGGWVLEIDPARAHEESELKAITAVTGQGPAPEILELADWAAWRYAGRRRQFLTVASPPRAVSSISDRPDRRAPNLAPSSPATTRLLAELADQRRTVGVLRLPPSADVMPAIASALAIGPVLIVTPEVDTAALLAIRLERAGTRVALLPRDWAAAAAGVDVVIGARRAAWAPCPELSVAVVIDEHDEALQSEASPTWHARDVLHERCSRAGARLLLISPAPSLHALALAPAVHPPASRERAGWPIVQVVDRRSDVPWKRSLLTSELIAHLRDPRKRVVCISNTTGRARLLACRSCQALARCERCEAAVVLDDDQRLVCPACGTTRPAVCVGCRTTAFANLRPGVTRLREELEAAAARPVMQITGRSEDDEPDAPVIVGTEAALHRVRESDVVAFLEFDRELLAPRYRAVEQALGLLVRAARLVGARQGEGRILVQTFLPDHPLIRAVTLGDPARIMDEERQRRELLGLPPAAALASITGPGADAFVATLADVETGGFEGEWLVRAPNWEMLANALRAGIRPPGVQVRVAVDPPRV